MSRSRKTGFTLLEMLTTVAAFVIILGLMVDLARHVRNASAIDPTKSLLRQLDTLMRNTKPVTIACPPSPRLSILIPPTRRRPVCKRRL